MSLYDLVMLVIFIGAILFGLWKGLAWQVASLAAIFLSYFVSITFRGQVAQLITAEEPWNRFAAMLILFLGTSLVVWTVFAMVKGRIREMELNGFDRQAGAIVGAVKGALLCMVVTMFAVSLLGQTARNAIYASRSGGYIVRGINQVSAVVPTEIHNYIDPYIAEFNSKIADPNGNLPYVEPLFGTQNGQQANSGIAWPVGGANTGNTASVPSYQRPYGQGANPSNGLPTSGQYSSGSYTQNPNQVPTYQGKWQFQRQPQPAANTTYQNNGYQNNRGYQNNNGYQQPSQSQQVQGQYRTPARTTGNSGFGAQPQSAAQADASAAQNTNGWPDLQFKVNSRELLDRAIDGGRRAIESATQR